MRLLYPGDEGFAEAVGGWQRTVEHHPAVVAVPADAGDVAEAVRLAAAEQRPVAVQSTGHGKSVPADGAVFIDTSALRELSVDPVARTARIGAGLRWGDVVEAAAEHGLAPLSGSSAGVGVMGYLTGGGLPATARTYGFAAGYVRSLDLVTADGILRTVSPSAEPELFWAVRGGRGNFGVVVAAEIDLVPLRTVYGGELRFPVADSAGAAHVLGAYVAWAGRQPEEMTSSVTLLPGLVLIRVVHAGSSASEGARLVEPLRALGPELDTCAVLPYARVSEIFQDPKGPVSVHLRGALLGELDDAAVKQLAAVVDPGAGPASLELRHLGGALDRPPARPHAASTRGAAFHLWVRVPSPPDRADAARSTADALLARVRPWDTGAMLPGFLFDHDTTPDRVRRAYSAADYRRLAAVKAAYDPDGMFRITHAISRVSSELED